MQEGIFPGVFYETAAALWCCDASIQLTSFRFRSCFLQKFCDLHFRRTSSNRGCFDPNCRRIWTDVQVCCHGTGWRNFDRHEGCFRDANRLYFRRNFRHGFQHETRALRIRTFASDPGPQRRPRWALWSSDKAWKRHRVLVRRWSNGSCRRCRRSYPRARPGTLRPSLHARTLSHRWTEFVRA